MKTKINILGKIAGAVAVLALVASLPPTAGAADKMPAMKGGEHLMMVNQINTKQDLDALKTGDSVAMVCAKCKTVWVTRVKQGVKGAELLTENGQPTELIGTHLCKSCSSKLTITGHAKGNTTELKHTCGACGDTSAFCCATKPGSGATEGMEKK